MKTRDAVTGRYAGDHFKRGTEAYRAHKRAIQARYIKNLRALGRRPARDLKKAAAAQRAYMQRLRSKNPALYQRLRSHSGRCKTAAEHRAEGTYAAMRAKRNAQQAAYRRRVKEAQQLQNCGVKEARLRGAAALNTAADLNMDVSRPCPAKSAGPGGPS